MCNNFDHCSPAQYHLSAVINIQNENNLLDHIYFIHCIFDTVDVIKIMDWIGLDTEIGNVIYFWTKDFIYASGICSPTIYWTHLIFIYVSHKSTHVSLRHFYLLNFVFLLYWYLFMSFYVYLYNSFHSCFSLSCFFNSITIFLCFLFHPQQNHRRCMIITTIMKSACVAIPAA